MFLGSFRLECPAALACTISGPLEISGFPANAPRPRISNQLKISGCWPDIHPPARRDRPLIHAPWNIVITLHIIGCPRSPLHPYAMGHCQPPRLHALWNIRGGYCGSRRHCEQRSPPGTWHMFIAGFSVFFLFFLFFFVCFFFFHVFLFFHPPPILICRDPSHLLHQHFSHGSPRAGFDKTLRNKSHAVNNIIIQHGLNKYNHQTLTCK